MLYLVNSALSSYEVLRSCNTDSHKQINFTDIAAFMIHYSFYISGPKFVLLSVVTVATINPGEEFVSPDSESNSHIKRITNP